ncbi:MAG: hypothetical protein ACHQ5A_11220 [Opitutales bacterium]
MNLQPLATTCFVTGEPFAEGDRVVSHLLRSASLEVKRCDVREDRLAEFGVEGTVVCRWIHVFKPRAKGENPERALKLTAESLFFELADPATEPAPENERLVQFLALMLERKKLLRPKGRNATGDKLVYEHARTKQRFEVSAGEMDPAFFVAVQEQLSVLVGGPGGRDPAPPVGAIAAELPGA